MVALLALLLFMPFALEGVWQRNVLSLLATLTFIGGIRALSNTKRHVVIGITLVIPPFIMQWVTSVFKLDNPSIFLLPSFYSLPFYIFLGYLIIKYIFQSGPVTRDRLFAAICFYLLMGIFWTHCYVIIASLSPGAFSFGSDGYVKGTLFSKLAYFSYVTLTTVGYGDITPVGPYAQSLAMLESIIGVLFLTTLVARLAGLYSPIKSNEED